MTETDFFEELQRHAPATDRAEARRIALAVCGPLGRHLTEAEVTALARHLPKPVADALHREVYDPERELDELYGVVADELGEDPRRGRELVFTVGSLIGATMDDEAAAYVEKLEPELSSLFAAPPPVGPAELAPHGGASTIAAARGGGRRPLSASRPGSEHPLSEADAPRGQPDSVARTDQPYASEKISSGVTHGTLARGRPPGTEEGGG